MSKFTIEVADDVSVAPLAKTLALHGYQLSRQAGTNALELTETEKRKDEIVAQCRRTKALRELLGRL